MAMKNKRTSSGLVDVLGVRRFLLFEFYIAHFALKIDNAV